MIEGKNVSIYSFLKKEKDPLTVFPRLPETSDKLDVNKHVLRNPESTFCVVVRGDSMIEVGIHPGDKLIVDRSLASENGSIVIAAVKDGLTVKKLRRQGGKLYLVPGNALYPCLEIPKEMNFMIWGVVTHVIHPLYTQNLEFHPQKKD